MSGYRRIVLYPDAAARAARSTYFSSNFRTRARIISTASSEFIHAQDLRRGCQRGDAAPDGCAQPQELRHKRGTRRDANHRVLNRDGRDRHHSRRRRDLDQRHQ